MPVKKREAKTSEVRAKPKQTTKKTTAKKTVKKVIKKEVVGKIKTKVSESKKSKVAKKITIKSEKNLIKALFAQERVLVESSDETLDLYNKSVFGTLLEDKKLQLSLQEALFLKEKEKIVILDANNKEYTFERYVKKATKIEPNFWVRYSVFKDMRDRGYIVKTALKFGADFRVYDRGIKPGEDHARWIIYPVHEGSTLTWYEFAAKNRVAHSTKKRLMMGVVDDEGDVTYWEIKWLRP
ncbi:MAG: tRNA-intron lyase [archaeon]